MAKKKNLETENVAYNAETGEILDAQVVTTPSLLPRSYITQPNYKLEVCDPTPCAFALEGKAPMDIRDMIIKFGYDKIAQPVDSTPFDETQISLEEDDGSDDDDERFNQAMATQPYAVGDDGLTNLERELAKEGSDIEEFRQWQSLKDLPAFQHFKSLSPEEQEKLIATLSQPVGDAGGTQPEPDKA